MARQFDLYRLPSGTYVVVLQSDLLDQMTTRVVAPLLPEKDITRPIRRLNPEVTVGAEAFVLMPQLAATLKLEDMGKKSGSLALWRDEIQRAVDTLLSGI